MCGNRGFYVLINFTIHPFHFMFHFYKGLTYIYTINLSRHEQVCLMRLFREIYGLIKHDVINLFYYEH